MPAITYDPGIRRYARTISNGLHRRERWGRLVNTTAAPWAGANIPAPTTTLRKNPAGRHEEANPVDASRRELRSVSGYAFPARLPSVLYGLLGVGKPRERATRTTAATTALGGVHTLLMDISNALHVPTGAELPLPSRTTPSRQKGVSP